MAKFHVSMPDALRDSLAQRGPISTIISRDLERYYSLLKRAEKELQFSDEEWRIVRHSTISTAFEPWSIPHIARAVADAYPQERDVYEKVIALSDAARFALVDTLEQMRDSEAE